MNVLHGVSGGIDSFYSTKLLREKGFQVKLLLFSIYFDEEDRKKIDRQIKMIALHYNVNYTVIDKSTIFKNTIVDKFFDEYTNGTTPNPCVLCNSKIKFKTLFDYSIENNFDYISTGHYANIGYLDGRYFICKGKDINKDQSYFLWQLPQEYLRKIIFPLGNCLKSEIKMEVSQDEAKLINSEESNDICFLTNNYYKEYICKKKNEYYYDKSDYKLIYNGNIVGHCNKMNFYTIGQRKGSNVSLGFPVYIQKIDAKNGIIYVSKKDVLFRTEFYISNMVYQKYCNVKDGFCCKVKIRYRSCSVNCRVFNISDKIVKVSLEEPIKSVTPGQSAVFYEDDDLVFGGVIIDKI